jgi:hypothetical protein
MRWHGSVSLLAVMLIAWVVSACGVEGITDDANLQDKLDPMLTAPGPSPLADLATYEWDRVYLFGPYTPWDEVESTVGGTVPNDTLLNWVPENEDLLVFNLDGKPVRLAHLSTILQPADRSQIPFGWSRNVLIEARCRHLYLHEPGQIAGPDDCST